MNIQVKHADPAASPTFHHEGAPHVSSIMRDAALQYNWAPTRRSDVHLSRSPLPSSCTSVSAFSQDGEHTYRNNTVFMRPSLGIRVEMNELDYLGLD